MVVSYVPIFNSVIEKNKLDTYKIITLCKAYIIQSKVDAFKLCLNSKEKSFKYFIF